MSGTTGSLVGPPPLVDVQGGGGGSEWVRLLIAGNDIEAALLTGRLEHTGIESRSVKYKGAPGAWLYGGSSPWAPVEVLVRRRQLEDARFVLAEIAFDGMSSGGPRRDPASRAWWAIAIVLGLLVALVWVLNFARATDTCPITLLC